VPGQKYLNSGLALLRPDWVTSPPPLESGTLMGVRQHHAPVPPIGHADGGAAVTGPPLPLAGSPAQCGARHITHTQCGARRIAPTPRVALRGSARKPCVGTIQPAKRDRSPQRRDAGQVKSGPLGRHYACHLIGASMTLFRPRATRCHGA